eukprot:TRINITY_DN25805_c0_g1_i1.p1 TRINITY_DN25805_c0_g1~~TRINITY_DN25805_c0_g1_i1.p1  ORF type:complete len:408 (+),score=109.85 TRINITY_DN25805_c0_g1_i1:109-1224(+)
MPKRGGRGVVPIVGGVCGGAVLAAVAWRAVAGAADPPAPTRDAPPPASPSAAVVPLRWPREDSKPACQWWVSAGWVCGGGGGTPATSTLSWRDTLTVAPEATVWVFGDALMHQQFGLVACAAAADKVTRRRWLTHTASTLGARGSASVPSATGRYRSRLPLFKDPLFMFQAYLNFARHGIVGELRPNSEWVWGAAEGVLMKGLELGGDPGQSRIVFQMLAPVRRAVTENPASAMERAPLKKGDVVVVAVGAEYGSGNATLLRSHQQEALAWLRNNARRVGLRASIWAEPHPQLFGGGGQCGGDDSWRVAGGRCEDVGAAADFCLPRWDKAVEVGASQLRSQKSCSGYCHSWMAAMNQQLHEAVAGALRRAA